MRAGMCAKCDTTAEYDGTAYGRRASATKQARPKPKPNKMHFVRKRRAALYC